METKIYNWKISNAKDVQTKQHETKCLWKYQNSSYVGYLLLGMRPTFKCGYIPSEMPLEKTSCSFATGSQLEITYSWLCPLPAFSVGTTAGLDLCMLPHSLWVHMYICPVTGKLAPWSHLPPWLLQIFHPFSANTFEPWGEECDTGFPPRPEGSGFSLPLYVVGQLWATVLIAMSWKKDSLM